MALEAGSTLGHYEVISSLGAGGMGEVYRAKDTKLGREVAIKVLPEGFSDETERMARFEREAVVLASLNHNNIATLYGFESDGDAQFLVMEVVEGETLAERIGRSAIPVDEALPLFLQIAEGLEAAHENGVIHRDLKPANIKITDAGQVKILDFGLAKAMAPPDADSGAVSSAESPTLTLAATMRGEILGTAAYMSPEQASGKAVNRLADVWSFGVCFYEALTGHRAFEADDAPNTLAAVLRDEVDLEALPADLTPALRRLVSRCLVRNPRNRLHDMADARLELVEGRETGDSPPGVGDPRARRRTVWIAATLALVSGLATGVLLSPRRGGASSGEQNGEEQAVRFVIEGTRIATDAELGMHAGGRPAVSPDGMRIAFPVSLDDGSKILVRDLSLGTALAVRGSEGGYDPFFSPDGRSLGFRRGQGIFSVPVEGGLVQPLAEIPIKGGGWIGGAAWGAQHIYFGLGTGELNRVPGGGGAIETVKGPGTNPVGYPNALPGGKVVLFTESSRIHALDVTSGETHDLGVEGQGPQFVDSGHLVFAAPGGLWAVPFDPVDLEVGGRPRLFKEIASVTDESRAPFAASPTGTVVSRVEARQTLVQVLEDGTTRPLGPEGWIRHPRWSPDGRWIAYTVGGVGSAAIWIREIATGRETRLSASQSNVFPVWTPDGSLVRFDPGGDDLRIVIGPRDRSEPVVTLFESEAPIIPMSVSRDGILLFFNGRDVKLWRLTLADPGDAEPWSESSAGEFNGTFHPNGRWVAYESLEDGARNVYVRPFSGTGAARIVSIQGGRDPAWSSDGRTLYYQSQRGLEAVEVQFEEDDVEPGAPRLLTDRVAFSNDGTRPYDPEPAGDGFVAVQRDANTSRLEVILNVGAELRRTDAGPSSGG